MVLRAHLTDRNALRVIVLCLFVGLLYFFRHLGPLFVFFVIFERAIGSVAGLLARWTKLQFKWAVLVVLLTGAAALGAAAWFGVATLVNQLPRLRESTETIIGTIRGSELYHRYGHLGAQFTLERAIEQAQHHASGAVSIAANVAREVLYVFIALVFAVVFLMEREELTSWREKMPMDSVPRILVRYLGHTADAVAITFKLQAIVAVVSAVITLPVLIALRLPGIPALAAMLVISGLIPVVGGLISGAVLMTLAYVTRGAMGLLIFVGSTFVLHKIESYYLNPKLTAKHIKLPSFVIITSLVLFEHAFGVVGLFLSFPCLYVAAKIREGWIDPEDELRDEEEMTRTPGGFEIPESVLKAFKGRGARAQANVANASDARD